MQQLCCFPLHARVHNHLCPAAMLRPGVLHMLQNKQPLTLYAITVTMSVHQHNI
jgi:hypothetical protein